MFHSTNKKFSNLKNISQKSAYYKNGSQFESPNPAEHSYEPYIPHEDYDYMKICNAG